MPEIKKISLVDQVYAQLRGEIITLKRPLGSRLNVSELQGELGVSCTPIREAINRLQQEGLVVYTNNVGARVLELSGHDVVEIQQVALTLHTAAIRLALEAGDREKVASELQKHLAEYRRARTPQEEALAVFHFVGTFYHNCGNRRLDQSMIAIQGQQLLLRNMYALGHARCGEDAPCYERILEAVRRGDAGEAQQALLENGEQMTRQLLELVSGR